MEPAEDLTDDELRRVAKRDPTHAIRSFNSVVICLYLVMGAFQHGQRQFASFAAIAGSFISLATMLMLSVVLHEIGHAVAARTVGFRPYAIAVGSGQSLLLRNVFGVTCRIGVIPGGGIAMFSATPNLSRIKWRLLATLAAGPIVSAALLLTGLHLFPSDWQALEAGTDAWLRPGPALVFTNALLLITTALPIDSRKPGAVQSDLVRIVTLPWMSQETIELLAQSEKVARVARLYVLRDYRALLKEGQAQLHGDPHNWGVRFMVASMLDTAGHYQRAAAHYHLLLESGALPSGKMGERLRALASNNLAWSLYLLDEPNQLDAAERAAKDALALNSNERAYLGTFGSILIERGQLEEGRRLVERAQGRQFAAIPIAFNCCALAMASARAGDVGRARRLLNKARRRDPENPLLPRVERELARALEARTSQPEHARGSQHV